MARHKMFDPSYQKCFTEAIEKERKLRMNWHLEFGSRGSKSDAVNWDEDPLDDGEAREDACIARAHPQPWIMPRKEERAWPASSAPATRTIPRVSQPPVAMKPVPRNVKKILYQGLSHDGEGRCQYLSRRYQDSPEQRYYFPICSSWEYGWTYRTDPAESLPCPRHYGRQT